MSVRKAIPLHFLVGGLGLTGRKAVKNNCGLVNCECFFAGLCVTNLADRHWLPVFSREWLAGKKMEHLLFAWKKAGEDV